MKVKELTDKLKEFSPDMKVTTFADYDESDHGDLHSLRKKMFMMKMEMRLVKK